MAGLVRRRAAERALFESATASPVPVPMPSPPDPPPVDPGPPPVSYIKVSGGLFRDMMIHDFDMARFLVGHEVEEVYAVAGVMVDESFRRLHDVDTAVTILKFENGVTATIDNCRQSAFG